MSITVPVSQEMRRKSLNRIAVLAIVLTSVAGILYGYLGVVSQNWYNFIVAGAFALIVGVSVLIIVSRHAEHPAVGAWHFISTIVLAALLISAIQANAGSEIGSAVLILTLVLVIQVLPPNQAMRGAALGAVASLACGVLAFYSPLPQITNATAELIIVWAARVLTLAILALIMTQFRTLNLPNKILISFLSVVVLISMTFNIVMSSSTVNTMTDQVGQQLLRVAEGRSVVLGDYLNGRLEALQTLALDETIRQSVGAANDLKPDLAGILELDEEWRQVVASGVNNPLVTNRLSNSLSRDLLAFQSLSPENIEVFVTDQAGALVSATNLTSDYYQADEDWWISAFNAGDGDVYISQPEFDESAGALSILMAVPVYDTRHGNLIGILRSTISIDSLVDVLNDPIGETGEVDIYFPDGTMLDTKTAEYEDINPDSSGRHPRIRQPNLP